MQIKIRKANLCDKCEDNVIPKMLDLTKLASESKLLIYRICGMWNEIMIVAI